MRRIPWIVVVVLLTACSSTGVKSSAEPRGSRDVITREQLAESSAANVYDHIHRARPEALRARGQSSIRGGAEMPVVYIDGVRRGAPELLRQIRLNDVEEIRFVNGTDASTRYGLGHGGGVIDVRTRQGQRG